MELPQEIQKLPTETQESSKEIRGFPLQELPPEIQERILRYHPELVIPYTKTSSDIRNITSRLYVEELCKRPISDLEIKAYLDESPTLFSIYYPPEKQFIIYYKIGQSKYIEDIFKLDINLIGRDTVDPYLTHFATNGPTYLITYAPVTDLGGVPLDSSTVYTMVLQMCRYGDKYCSQLDLLSIYRILQNRLGCVYRQPDYAKQYVLKYLDDVYNEYLQNRTIDILINTHAYLFIHSKIFNIYPSIQPLDIHDWIIDNTGKPIAELGEFLSDFDKRNMSNTIKTMEKEIYQMYVQIRNILEHL